MGGGLPGLGAYLLKGAAGTGKTTIALQFLLEGTRLGQKCLFLSMAETRGQLALTASSFAWNLSGIDVHEMRRRGSSPGQGDSVEEPYTVFPHSEIELGDITREMTEQLERVHPERFVIDSLSEIRLTSEDSSRYRREILTLNDLIDKYQCAAWFIDVAVEGSEEAVAETLVNGVVHLEYVAPGYGADRRRLRVEKLRASKCLGGYHDFTIGDHGVHVYPRLVAASTGGIRPSAVVGSHSSATLSSGMSDLDNLLGGGLEGGTSTVLMGPAGTGKSTVAAQFVTAAGVRGERAVMLCFDEPLPHLLRRTESLGIPLAEQVEAGTVELQQIAPAEVTPGELADRLRIEANAGARVVVIDSINGYINALPEERFLAAHLHELLAFLSEKGVVTILTLSQQGVFGPAPDALVYTTYVADAVVVFRYFEDAGELKKALTVVKKRTTSHEHSVCELQFGRGGLRVGPALKDMKGLLSGNPMSAQQPLRRNVDELPSE
jgi:circadian clock protein KaiC